MAAHGPVGLFRVSVDNRCHDVLVLVEDALYIGRIFIQGL